MSTNFNPNAMKINLHLDSQYEIFTQESFGDLVKNKKEKNLVFVVARVFGTATNQAYYFDGKSFFEYIKNKKITLQRGGKLENPLNREDIAKVDFLFQIDEEEYTLFATLDKQDLFAPVASAVEKEVDYLIQANEEKGHLKNGVKGPLKNGNEKEGYLNKLKALAIAWRYVENKNDPMAHHFLEIAADKGSAKAIKQLVKSNTENSSEAIRWLEKLAASQPNKMDAKLFFLLAAHYDKIENNEKALENFKKAAELGHEYAIAKLIEAAEELDLLPAEEGPQWRDKLPEELQKLSLDDLFDVVTKK